MNGSPAELEKTLWNLLDRNWEPAYDEYKHHLKALTEIIRAQDVELEGSLFNKHLIRDIPDEPDPDFHSKRINFASFCIAGERLLEIGFNAGHSAMLALTMNKELTYTGVDMNYHKYMMPCYEYLRSVFGDRIKVIVGDSRAVLPSLREQGGGDFDLYHLDGGHGFDVAMADLCNILSLAKRPATLLFDDTGHPDLDALCDYFVMRGRLQRIQCHRIWSDTINHRLFRTSPA